MKYLIGILNICILLALSAGVLQAVNQDATESSGGKFEKVGAAGGQFLKIHAGARGTAMGGAFGAVADDLTSIYWNPAGLADVRSLAANFSYTQWFAGFTHNFGAAALPLGDNFTAGVHLISFTSNEIPVTTIEKADGDGTYYTVSDLSLGVTIAGYLTEQFSFGITGKYVQNAFASLSSGGIAFDIGTRYETGFQGIKLGFSIHNLGTEQTYDGNDLHTETKLNDAFYASPLDASYLASSYNLPLAFRAGIASNIFETEDHLVIAAIDFTTYSDIPEQFAFGAEYTYKSILSIRGGYVAGHDIEGLSGGIGINYLSGGFNGQINYSISPMGDFGIVNRLSVGIKLD